MDKTEFGKLVKIMKTVYTSQNFIADNEAFEVWYSLLSDLDYNTASAAVKKYMLTNHFPPSVADIREAVKDLKNGEQLTGNEAWAMVSRAIRNGIYGYKKEFDKLPPVVQRAVGSADQLHFMALADDYNEDVARSSFMKSYEVALKQADEKAELTPDIARMTEAEQKLIDDTLNSLPGAED